MKYKVGDKVRIRRDLKVGNFYDEWLLTDEMEEDIKSNDYILTISKAYIAYDNKTPVYNYKKNTLRMDLCSKWELTESMIEGLVETELTDREKFEGWMRKLSSSDSLGRQWIAFNNLTMLEPNDDEYESNLEIVSDFLFGVVKKNMTKAEIEAELGYEIEIVEE